MRVGIVGSGEVGQTLGRGFAARRHNVMLGSRTPDSEKVVTWIEETKETDGETTAGTFRAATQFGELVVLATLWAGTENAIELAGPENFAGKLVIDVTNPMDFSLGMPPFLTHGNNDSGAEQIQRWLPKARIVKAFNIVNPADMVDPHYRGGVPDMFVCGNDEKARSRVADICRDFGWKRVTDIGDLKAARHLEALANFWVHLAMVRDGTWRLAFSLLTK
ncbi:MAG: NADPH-dependent F420 reductase [Rhodothermia bacterium]